MQFNFEMGWDYHFAVLFIIVLNVSCISWMIYSDLYHINGTVVLEDSEKSLKYFKNITKYTTVINLCLYFLTYLMSYKIHTSENEEDFRKRTKEPKYLIIKNKIVPVTDTLIVIGYKKLGRSDTVQIEDFYKYKEFKNEH